MKKVKKATQRDSELNKSEKIQVIITEILDPIIAGAIYYYGWRKKLPTKAKQANKYSFITLGIIIAVNIALPFIFE